MAKEKAKAKSGKAKAKPGKMYAILSRCQRTGRLRLASRFSVLALFGVCLLDLREARAEGDSSRLQVRVLLGSARVILPHGAEVRPSGLSLLSASSVDVPQYEEESDLPPMEIEWTAIFGRLRIETEKLPATEDSRAASDPPQREETEPPPDRRIETAPTSPPEEAAPAVGFEDLEEPEPGEDANLEEASTPDEASPAVGFEDLEAADDDHDPNLEESSIAAAL